MGLGAPVCTDCEVILEYSNEIPQKWRCPVCLSENKYASLWELSEEDQDLYRKNTEKFKE